MEYGYIFLTDEEESKIINVSLSTIKRMHKSLQDKGLLDIMYIDGKRVKRFNLKKLQL